MLNLACMPLRLPRALLWTTLVAGTLLSGCLLSARDRTMPEAEQAYWDWARSIRENPVSALETGVALLKRYPEQKRLYLRLAEICRETQRPQACHEAFAAVAPPDSLAALYREAATALLLPDEAAAPRWRRLARSPFLDPSLARLVADKALRQPAATLLTELRALWQQQLATHPDAPGATFGLGYLAVRQAAWAEAEHLLRRAAELAPDNPEPYRELGRLYFHTARPEALADALEAGIQAAEAQHDLQTELILRGNLGMALMEQQGDLTGAERMFQAALTQSRTLADPESEGFNLYRLANVQVRKQHYQEALGLLAQADTLMARYNPRQRSEVQVLIGFALSGLFRFSDAEAVLEAAVAEARTHRHLSAQLQALTALAHLRFQMGRYTLARQTALDILALSNQYQSVKFEISARMVLGDVEDRWGNYEAALAHYEEALALARQHSRHVNIRDLYQRLGQTALNMHNTDTAKDYYEALLQHERQYADSTTTARSYLGMSNVYLQFGNYKQAATYLEQARALLSPRHHAPLLASTLLRLGWNALMQNDVGAAATYFEEARALVEQARLEPTFRFRMQAALGTLALHQGRPHEALRHLNRALSHDQAARHPARRWTVLHTRAQTYLQLGQRSDAEADFREAIALIETIRDQLNAQDERAAFIQDKVQVYKHFVAFLEAEGRYAEAFHFTERARSRSLADLLFTTQQDQATRNNDTVAEQLFEAERRRRAISEALNQDVLGADLPRPALDPTRASELARAYAEADALYQRTLNLLPADRMLGALLTLTPLSARATQRLLGPREALVVYTLRPGTRATGDVVAYLLTPDTLAAIPLPTDPVNLSESIRFFRDQITASAARNGTAWQKTSQRLYARLLAPLLAHLPPATQHLHIVPEGPLYYLPFAALQTEDGTFLIEQYTVSTIPSASILQIAQAHNPGQWRSILLVADPARSLPGSRREAEAIAALPDVQATPLIGEEANRANLQRLAGAFDVLHIATHGRFVPRAPWFSHLELADGPLNVADIGRLQLNAYLVTLSACETALGSGFQSDIPAGDEWVGLNQAFLAAGAPTVMASLWPIDDQKSSSFMAGFYEQLLQTRNKARALAAMQRRFLRDPGTRHPYYWAPFTLIGDPR